MPNSPEQLLPRLKRKDNSELSQTKEHTHMKWNIIQQGSSSGSEGTSDHVHEQKPGTCKLLWVIVEQRDRQSR